MSFHFPGWTRFYVFTALAHQIVWLPEQISGIAAAAFESLNRAKLSALK